MAEFKPYIPHDSKEPEFTLKAVLAGLVMAAVFGSANAYLGMKAGQTVAATIPAAVIAIALFRLPFFRGSVLEQNLTRTSASVGEALVAGAVFTIPAFMMVNVAGERLWIGLRGHYLGIHRNSSCGWTARNLLHHHSEAATLRGVRSAISRKQG